MEIEVKFQLDTSNQASFEAWLAKLPVPREERLVEYYFDKDDSAFAKGYDEQRGFVDALGTLRLRFTGERATRTEKRRILGVDGRTSHREETEVEMSAEEGEVERQRLLADGYHETCLRKTRFIYRWDVFEIVCDIVDDLGTFYEVELKDQAEQNAQRGKTRIYELLKQTCGVSCMREFDRGYIHMGWNPGVSFGEERVL